MGRTIGHAELAAFAERHVNLPRDMAAEKRAQVNTLRERLMKHVEENPEFSLVKMLHAGSVAKGTALRTFNDFDVAVYVRQDEAPDDTVELIDWMTERLREAYGGLIDPSQIEVGTHCATITFVGTGTSVDVVPVLYEGEPDDRGYLVAKGTGDKLLTSVRLHLDFVRERKRECPDHWAQVVRFLKWWVREQKVLDDQFKFKSFMVELLCAHVLDADLVAFTDYPVALEGIFDYIVRTELNERIAFTDYYERGELPVERVHEIEIFDPVNPINNAARLYTEDHRKRIVLAAEGALDAIVESGYATTRTQEVECWQVVLGPRFRG